MTDTSSSGSRAMADGDIRPWPGEDTAKKGRKAKRIIVILVQQLENFQRSGVF